MPKKYESQKLVASEEYQGVYIRYGIRDTSYVIRPYINGKEKPITVGKKSRGYTEEMAYEYLKKIKGIMNDPNIKDEKTKSRVIETNNMTLQQLRNKYFKQKREEAEKEIDVEYDQRNEKSAKTLINIKKEESVYKNFWGDWNLCFQKMENIEEEQVHRYLNQRLLGTNGKKYSPKSVDNAVALINSIVKHTGYSGFNAFANIKKFVTSRNRNTRKRFLSQNEMNMLIKAAKEELNEQNYLMIMTSLLTGARPDSVIHLRTRDVDLKHNKITFWDFKRKMYYTRNMPLKLGKLLSSCIDKNRKFVFYSNRTKGEKPMSSEMPKAITTLLNDLFNQDIREDEEKVVPYSLRHTYANTLLQVKQIPIEKVSYMLNHASVQTTMNNYIHMLDEHVKEADMSDLFDEEDEEEVFNEDSDEDENQDV